MKRRRGRKTSRSFRSVRKPCSCARWPNGSWASRCWGSLPIIVFYAWEIDRCFVTLRHNFRFSIMYPEEMVKPMAAELTDAGFEALYTAADVESALEKSGT